MSVDVVLLIVGAVFVILLLSECPVAFTLAASGSLGVMLLRNAGVVGATLRDIPYSSTASYSLSIIPMYILLGMFALNGRLAERIYLVASRSFGRLRGGLGVATVGACAGFAAVTGSSVATAATIGRLSISEMRLHGYPAPFAAGIVAAAGTLGVLIPPSVVLVFYGILARESIGQLLVAGIIPGVLSALLYIVYILTRGQTLVAAEEARLADVLAGEAATASDGETGGAPDANVDAGAAEASNQVSPARESRWTTLRAVGWIATIFAIIITGIYTGQFTVVESGAMGALVALVMLITEVRRSGGARLWHAIRESLLDTASITSMAFAILVGASIFTIFLVMARVPMRFTEWVVGLQLPPIVVVIIILAALIPLGMALETLSIIIITVPLIHPVVTGLGYDAVWFGILFVKMIEIGLVTPPVGMNAYVVSGASGVPVEKTFRGVAPFVLIDIVTVALLIAFPAITLWLPRLADV
ncbi:TRAP transporter large permease [Roseovarius sp.]|uniref:TRAP transporter large permease n=1 Tax=Roseovarius sp. TaxID=1486281 RepID=UPI003568B555